MAGKTVEEATEHALDQLGVALGDAEVIVVDEPRPGSSGVSGSRPGCGPACVRSGHGPVVSARGATAAVGVAAADPAKVVRAAARAGSAAEPPPALQGRRPPAGGAAE